MWKILIILSVQWMSVQAITGKFEATISFDVEDSLEVYRSEGVHYIPLKRTGIYEDLPLRVHYMLIQGTAEPGVDYVAADGDVVFKGEQMSGEIPLELIQGKVSPPRGERNLMVFLTSEDASIGDINPLFVTVYDDPKDKSVAAEKGFQKVRISWIV